MKFRMAYTLSVWLVGAFIGITIFYWGYFLFTDERLMTTKRFMEALSRFPFSIWIYIVLSFPGYLLLWPISYLLSAKTALSTLKIKGWVAFFAVVLCASTFVYFRVPYNLETLRMFLCFAIPFVFCAYFFKLKH